MFTTAHSRNMKNTNVCFWSITYFIISANFCVANSFSKFGIIRANIAQYLSDNRWLVCYEPKLRIEAGFIAKTEVAGCDIEGNLFVIRGNLRENSKNLLSLESYDNPSVTFSTKEGYVYAWNPAGDGQPFEYPMKMVEYEKLIEKFELYPLLGNSMDAPIRFELLKGSPDFYDRALGLPRPQSMFHLEKPEAKRLKIGMFLKGVSNTQSIVQDVVNDSPAAAAGVKPGDIIASIAVNGTNTEMEKLFPIPNDKSIRMLSLTVIRNPDEERVLILDLTVFLPSPLESFLLR